MDRYSYKAIAEELYSRIFDLNEGDPKDIFSSYAKELYLSEGVLLSQADAHWINREIEALYDENNPEAKRRSWVEDFGYEGWRQPWEHWFEFDLDPTEVPDDVYDAIVTILYDMAEEDRYFGKMWGDGEKTFEWVHGSEDGDLDRLYALLDFDNSEFGFVCQWCNYDGNPKPIHTRDFDKFLKDFLILCGSYETLNREALATLKEYSSGV